MTRTFRALVLSGLAAFGLFGVATSASADTETFMFSVSPQSQAFTVNFTLPSFDPSLGTLTGVTVTTAESGTATLTVINTTASAQSFTNGSASFPFTVSGPANTVVNTTGAASGIAGTVAASSTGSFAGNPFTSSSSVNVAPSGFGAYTGAGPVNLNFSASVGNGTYTGTAASGVAFTGSGSVGGSVTLVYTFTHNAAVPEPASLAMVALGLGGVAGVRRIRNRRVG